MISSTPDVPAPDYYLDELAGDLEPMEAQLMATPNKSPHVEAMLDVIGQARTVRHPIANLYAKVWSPSSDQPSEAAAEVLSSLGLDPNIGDSLEPGEDHYLAIEDAKFGSLKLHGTVDEHGRMNVLDVTRQTGTLLDRSAWMGSHHNRFALLLVVEATRSDRSRMMGPS